MRSYDRYISIYRYDNIKAEPMNIVLNQELFIIKNKTEHNT